MRDHRSSDRRIIAVTPVWYSESPHEGEPNERADHEADEKQAEQLQTLLDESLPPLRTPLL